jgi:hypothetical protein
LDKSDILIMVVDIIQLAMVGIILAVTVQVIVAGIM